MSGDGVVKNSASNGESAESELLRRTALHANHVRLGGRLVPFAGYEMPVQYTSIKEEHLAVRERAGLFDVSHMGQIQLRGDGAVAYLESLLTCNVASLGVGRARYGLMLNDQGGCIDDVMLTRVADDTYFLCVNASNVENAGPGFRTTASRRSNSKIAAKQLRCSLSRAPPPAASLNDCTEATRRCLSVSALLRARSLAPECSLREPATPAHPDSKSTC